MTDHEAPDIIDSVPGMAAPESPVDPAQLRQPVSLEGFQGDPKRVLGHPANEAGEAAIAYGAQLNADAEAAKRADIPVRYVKSAGSVAIDVKHPGI